MEGDRLPEDLRKYSRYFLKNLFRLNNIHGQNEFFYPPEVIERYWELIAPDQGVFSTEISPISQLMVVKLFHTSKCFGLKRSDNPDYYSLLEFLAREQRRGVIKGCRVELRGLERKDDLVLEEMLGIETELFDDHMNIPFALGLPHELSAEGLEAFRKRLWELSGIRAAVRFPVGPSAEGEDRPFSTIGFRIALSPDGSSFLLDGVPVSQGSTKEAVYLVGGKLLDMSAAVYREPQSFPRPEVESLDEEVHRLIARAEKDGLSDELAREIVVKITILDYYESLAGFSNALGEELVRYLTGTQVVTFTMPRVLRAFLDRLLEERDLDEIIVTSLEAGKGGA